MLNKLSQKRIDRAVKSVQSFREPKQRETVEPVAAWLVNRSIKFPE